MTRKSSRRRAAANALPAEVGLLLEEIEKEPAPERLLDLAKQLQEALARRHWEAAEEAPTNEKRARRS